MKFKHAFGVIYVPETWNVNVIPMIFIYYASYVYKNNLFTEYLPINSPLFDYNSFHRHKKIYTNQVDLNPEYYSDMNILGPCLDYIMNNTTGSWNFISCSERYKPAFCFEDKNSAIKFKLWYVTNDKMV